MKESATEPEPALPAAMRDLLAALDAATDLEAPMERLRENVRAALAEYDDA